MLRSDVPPTRTATENGLEVHGEVGSKTALFDGSVP